MTKTMPRTRNHTEIIGLILPSIGFCRPMSFHGLVTFTFFCGWFQSQAIICVFWFRCTIIDLHFSRHDYGAFTTEAAVFLNRLSKMFSFAYFLFFPTDSFYCNICVWLFIKRRLMSFMELLELFLIQWWSRIQGILVNWTCHDVDE